VRFPKAKGLGVPLDAPLEVLPLGRSELVREGTDLIFAVGNMAGPAVEAARELEKDGLSFAVVNARFVKPLDRDMILRFAGPGRTVVTLEDGIVEGGAGSAVRELLDREGRFGVRFKSIGLPVGPYLLGKTEEIRAALGLDVPGLVRAIRGFCEAPRA
jgi:1-deoxy-D-xylulose-5-phosphate synthase